MPILTVNDGRIYYEESGSGPPVVLAHGVGGNHAVWFQQLPDLAARYRAITFDHRGFGLSTDCGGHGRSQFVADLEALLDHLGVERAALIGQSMGGGTCLGFAAAHPERTSALVLCDTLHGFAESGPVRRIMDRARAATGGLSQLERVLGERIRLGDPTRATLYLQLSSFNATDRHTLTGSFCAPVSPEALARTRIPVLFIVGADDVLFPPAAVRAVHRETPGSRYIEIADCGHSAFFEEPAVFNAAVMRFLGTVLA